MDGGRKLILYHFDLFDNFLETMDLRGDLPMSSWIACVSFVTSSVAADVVCASRFTSPATILKAAAGITRPSGDAESWERFVWDIERLG